MDSAIKKLRDDKHYYGEFGKQYLSNSDIKSLREHPASFKKQEETVPMLFGRYFHTYMLEPDKVSHFQVIDSSTRSTKIYKEALAESGSSIILLKKEVDEAMELADIIRGNLELYELIYDSQNKYEVPDIIELHGEMWKMKRDVDHPQFTLDLKTTSDISKFRTSAYRYNYDSQGFIYSEGSGKPMKFIVACKKTKQVGLFDCTPDFLERGNEKVMDAVIMYRRFFKEGSPENISNYMIKESL